MMFTANTLEEPVSETDFLSRELGIAWRVLTHSELERVIHEYRPGASRCLIATSGPIQVLDLVRRAPQDSVVLLILGDEAHDRCALELASLDAVHKVFKQYSWDRMGSWAYLTSIVTFFIDSVGSGVRWKDILKQVVKGVRSRRRQQAWQALGSRVLPFPLGYTTAFAGAYAELHSVPPTMSLINASTIESNMKEKCDFGFSGDRGQAQRQVCLSRVAREHSAIVRWTKGRWNGALGKEQAAQYVGELKRCRFSLCPPGGTSNETFRITESVICGALPVLLTSCVSQGAWLADGLRLGIVRQSWKQSFRESTGMSEESRLELLREAHRRIQVDLETVHFDLEQACIS